jgi:nucleoside-diphosphate-sugar epimerase/SAM-dependent methyltransferase
MFNPKSKIIEEDMKNISKQLESYYDNISGKTFLITGGAGFLGRYLVSVLDYLNYAKLIEKPCKIILVDNFITGIRDWIVPDDNLILINQDITKPLKIDEPVDYIIHAASLASPKFYYKYRLETINVGIAGTTNMLELAKEKNVKSFLFTSSSEIYGSPDAEHVPTNEEYWGNVSCTGPRACYDEPKRIGETLCVNYADVYNIPVKIVRPFNVFGPGMRLDDGRALANFILSALKGEKIPVYGDGKNTRTFCYISNFIVGLYQVLFSSYNKEPFNVGIDYPEISMIDLANLVSFLVENRDSKVDVVVGPSDVYTKINPERRCPDLTKVRRHIGYNPKVGLIPGITRYIEWIKEELKNQEDERNFAKDCKLCGNTGLKKFISLGDSPLANSLVKYLSESKDLYPLDVAYCPNCHNCQLSYIVPRDKLFKSYNYVTSTTKTFRDHFAKMAEDITKDYKLNSKSLVVDIGSNDGLLLKTFNKHDINTIGIEPAKNIADIAIKDGVNTIIDYFNDSSVNQILNSEGSADVITANNVFAHTENLSEVISNVKRLLKENGIFVIECQSLLDTLKQGTFDNIYHEHIHYFNLLALNNFFNKNGMEIFKVQHVDSHGGSLRVFVQKKGGKHKKESSVQNFLKEEKKFGLDKLQTYKEFAKNVYKTKDNFVDVIKKLKSEKKTIVGYGAPAKATTFLNFCGITNKDIDYIVDDNPLKQGLIVPGVDIPIKDKEYLKCNTPDYIIILAWNFADEILKNLKAFKDKGVKFIIPLPKTKII